MGMPDKEIQKVHQAYTGASWLARQFGRWVMDKPAYDRMRAAFWSEDQEKRRAAAHANAFMPAAAEPPYSCPVCPCGPFTHWRGLLEHIAQMANPAFREPQDTDRLWGLPIVVRSDGGEPHLEEWLLCTPDSRAEQGRQ